MSKQVLLINITRMGTLLQRLQYEWPGAAVDLVVDRRFAPIAKLLPHLRHIIEYDFHRLVDESRAQTKDVVTLYREMTGWAAPLIEARYDRVVNLTFNRRSGLLASYVGAKEIRGIAAPKDGDVAIHNPWMAYLTDVHSQRQFNHFNLVDIYALGGSGTGPFAPLSLDISPDTAQWARDFFAPYGGQRMPWTAVQVGASDPMKAWRPELFGQTLAALSRQTPVGYVFIGTESERKAIETAQMAYRQAGGRGPLQRHRPHAPRSSSGHSGDRSLGRACRLSRDGSLWTGALDRPAGYGVRALRIRSGLFAPRLQGSAGAGSNCRAVPAYAQWRRISRKINRHQDLSVPPG